MVTPPVTITKTLILLEGIAFFDSISSASSLQTFFYDMLVQFLWRSYSWHKPFFTIYLFTFSSISDCNLG